MNSSRTLVISDLHFGKHDATDVLRRPAARAPLLRALAGCDRLVLLGDLLELRHGPLREALHAAAEPLREIGSALGPDGEVVITVGNHDHYLVDGWSERRAAIIGSLRALRGARCGPIQALPSNGRKAAIT